MEDLKKAILSGLSGYKAMTIQVCSLMWLRTIMNYQHKYGTSLIETIKILYGEGGIQRFYSGILPALILGPVSRFGDTFSNALILNLTKQLNFPIFVKTGLASITAGLVRIIVSPIDTIKTMKQVEGTKSNEILQKKIKQVGNKTLFEGAIASCVVTLIGHYPWFVVHNYLNKYIPYYNSSTKNLLRNAAIGFCCSLVSDTITNSLRVIKTKKQTNKDNISYIEAINKIIEEEGIKGIFLRGLGVRIITNGVQSLMFNILWKYFESGNRKAILGNVYINK
jgi:hypothetical protein